MFDTTSLEVQASGIGGALLVGILGACSICSASVILIKYTIIRNSIQYNITKKYFNSKNILFTIIYLSLSSAGLDPDMSVSGVKKSLGLNIIYFLIFGITSLCGVFFMEYYGLYTVHAWALPIFVSLLYSIRFTSGFINYTIK